MTTTKIRCALKKEGSRAPKGALSNQCPRKGRLRAFGSPVLRCLQERIGEGARRLSALTLAALATGFYPDGSTPEPGFPRLSLAGFCPFRQTMPQLSTLRADRSYCRSTGDPEPPGCGWQSARGHRASLSSLRHAFRKGALNKAR
jgi:hypothetical protein